MSSMNIGCLYVWTTHLFNLLRLRVKPLGNEYFDIKRVGNNVYVQSKQKLGSYGRIVMSKDAIEQVMRSTRAAAYDENAFFGISGNCLKDLRVGQNLVCILRRKGDQLRLEMVQGGCKKLCVNEHFAGNCAIAWSNDNDRRQKAFFQ